MEMSDVMMRASELRAMFDDPAPQNNGLSPDGVVRNIDQIPFGHMIITLEAPFRGEQYALGESVQATVVRKVWNGTKYVNGDSQEGIDVWNAAMTKLQEMRLGHVMRLEAIENAVRGIVAHAATKVQIEQLNAITVNLEKMIVEFMKPQMIEGTNERKLDWTQPVAAQILAKINEKIAEINGIVEHAFPQDRPIPIDDEI